MKHKALIRRLQISCLGLDPIDPLRLLVDDVIAALAQPDQDHIPDARKMVTEQEPVAHCEAGPEYCPVCNTELNQEPAIYPEEAYEMGLEEIAFYTAPPRRTWVELTDEDIWAVLQFRGYNTDTIEIARAIEAKLKELNT